jgi:hypothetical protein
MRNVHPADGEQPDDAPPRLSLHPQTSKKWYWSQKDEDVECHVRSCVPYESRVEYCWFLGAEHDAFGVTQGQVPVCTDGPTAEDCSEPESDTPEGDDGDQDVADAAGGVGGYVEEADVLEEDGDFDEGG